MRGMRLGLPAVGLLAAGLALLPGVLHAQKKQRDVITREEIQASPRGGEDLFQLIRSLRPHFLEPPREARRQEVEQGPVNPMTAGRVGPSRGAGGDELQTMVFRDGNHVGGLDALKLIPADLVEEVRYYDPNKAATEFGAKAGGAAIAIRMHRGEPPKP